VKINDLCIPGKKLDLRILNGALSEKNLEKAWVEEENRLRREEMKRILRAEMEKVPKEQTTEMEKVPKEQTKRELRKRP
jgi:hypothetical protein